MSVKLLTRKTIFLFVCLWLTSCSKDKESTPAAEQNCVLLENNITSNAGNSASKFSFDAAGKLIKRESWDAGKLIRYNEFEYNEQQLIEKELFYKANGTLEGFYTYSYDDAGLLLEVDSWQFINGALQLTFISVYEYLSDDKLGIRAMWHPDGRLMNYYTFDYEQDEMRTMNTFNANGEQTHTLTLQYDDKTPVLKNLPALQKANLSMAGFPFQHNVTHSTNITSTGQVLGDSFIATFDYNDSGYPQKVARTYADGRTSEITHTYQCK